MLSIIHSMNTPSSNLYDQRAQSKAYSAFLRIRAQLLKPSLIRAIQPILKENQKCLDVGAGQFDITEVLRQAIEPLGGEITPLDSNPHMIYEGVKKYPHFRDKYIQKNILEGGGDSGNDIVFCAHILQCFSENEMHQFLTKIKEILQPGGNLVVVNSFYSENAIMKQAFIALRSLHTKLFGGEGTYHNMYLKDFLKVTEEHGFKKMGITRRMFQDVLVFKRVNY